MPALEPVLRARLVSLFDAYAKYNGLAVTTLSGKVTGNARFYDSIKDGSAVFSVYAYDKIIAKFTRMWPAALPWPDDIEKVEQHEIRERRRKPRRNRAA